MPSDLRPTLWRSMRVLASRRRLRLLAELFRNAPLSVSDCARRCHMPRVSATICLRQLQARGLIRAERVSRWVWYRPQPDPLVAHAAEITAAMHAALDKRGADPRSIIRAATAFTHERRIRIVQALVDGEQTLDRLVAVCGISPPALARHVDKLARHGVVARADDRVRLFRPADPLAAALLATALADRKPR
jgi:DNA-binding IclR family transcriptional regulator